MCTTYRIYILFLFLNFSFTSVDAQTDFELTKDTLLLDSSILYGRLPNGFAYFIKSVPSPQSKLFLRFYNKAGSNQDDYDQLNMAHAVEHLAFKATQNFPSGIRNSERINKLDIGMYDFSATSGPRNTEYYFDAPKNSTEALKTGLLWFKDIANGLNLTETDINQVRGELRQEFLSKVGGDLNKEFAETKMYAKLFPCNQDNTDFIEYHETFSAETLRRFYKDWYRPDLLAISIVGNIEDPYELERRIKETFYDIVPMEDRRKLVDCDAAYYNQPSKFALIELQSDPSELIVEKSVKIHLFFHDSKIKENFHAKSGIERLLKFQFLVDIVNERLKEATNEYKSFDVYSGDLYKYKKMPLAMEVSLSVENGKEEKALKKTTQVLHQLQTYGASNWEWEKMKEKRLQFMAQVREEGADYWINEISKYYNFGEALPGNKHGYLEEWLTDLSLDGFNNYLQKFLSKSPENIGIIAPSGQKAVSFTEKEVRSWMEDVYAEPVKPYELPKVPATLMAAKEVAKLKEKGYEDKGTGETGARKVMLDNGVKVVLKAFKPASESDQAKIKIQGFSLKGASSFSKGNYFSAINAPAIVRNAGVNGLDKFRLNRFLSTTSLLPGSVAPYVNDQESGIYGDATLEDFEIMLQLTYLYFTSPNKDKVAFDDWKIAEHKAFKNPSYNLIHMDFINGIRSITGDSSLSSNLGRIAPTGTIRYKSVEKTNFEDAYNAYGQLFGNGKDFTFIISGDFEIQSILPLVRKYLGNLPSLSQFKTSTTATGDIKEILTGPLSYEIPVAGNYKMENINYEIRYIQQAEFPNDWKEQLRVEALGGVIRHKLWALRFEKGYSLYDVKASGQFNENLDRYEINAKVDCEPKELQLIQKELKQIFSEIKSGLISKEDFQQGLHRMYSLYDAKRASIPRFMHQRLYRHYRYGQPWVNPAEVEQYVKSLTLEDILEVANKYCIEENLFEVLMRGNEVH